MFSCFDVRRYPRVLKRKTLRYGNTNVFLRQHFRPSTTKRLTMDQRPRALPNTVRHLPNGTIAIPTMGIIPDRQITSKYGIRPSLVNTTHRKGANNGTRTLHYLWCNVLNTTKLPLKNRTPPSSAIPSPTGKNVSSSKTGKRFALRSNMVRFLCTLNRRKHNVTILYNRRRPTNIFVSPIRQTRRQTFTINDHPNNVTINRNVPKMIRNKISHRVKQFFRRRNGDVLMGSPSQSLELKLRTKTINKRQGTSRLPYLRATINRGKGVIHGGTTTVRFSHPNRLHKSNAPTRGTTRRRTVNFKQSVRGRLRPLSLPGVSHRV